MHFPVNLLAKKYYENAGDEKYVQCVLAGTVDPNNKITGRKSMRHAYVFVHSCPCEWVRACARIHYTHTLQYFGFDCLAQQLLSVVQGFRASSR